MKVRYTICYFSSIMIFRAYCVGRVDNMLPTCRLYYDNNNILCFKVTQYATLVVL